MHIERDINKRLLQWKKSDHRQPLVLQGARQTGKSYTLTEFGRQHYEHVAVFNFDRQTELASVFEKTKDVRRILQELTFYTGVPLIQGKTLLFFDEIQECQNALNALKYFSEEAPDHHVVCAGSLLGVALNKSGAGFPVGKVHFDQLFPVTFKEFLRAADSTLYNRTCQIVTDGVALPDIVFSQLLQYYHSYQMCGGLPRAASAFLSGEGSDAVEEILTDILKAYASDFSKHIDNKDVPRIHEIWRSIPSQLSRENKKFIFRIIRTGARAREYEAALDWLSLSGMIYKIFVSETPLMPLSFYEDTTAFKVYLLDIALLRRLAGLPREVIIANGELFKEFKGALAENFILNSLLAQGVELPHYWTLQGNRAEVDFLVPNGLSILPIEVKSDERISGKSFAVFDEKYHPDLRLRFSLRNVKRDGNLLNLPIFLADWMKHYL
ncbi:MAG: ATP-binding protein [Prevotella sp.]|nr:ATP-binding protein [Prevotella sp.]